jgi:hypothetical protein
LSKLCKVQMRFSNGTNQCCCVCKIWGLIWLHRHWIISYFEPLRCSTTDIYTFNLNSSPNTIVISANYSQAHLSWPSGRQLWICCHWYTCIKYWGQCDCNYIQTATFENGRRLSVNKHSGINVRNHRWWLSFKWIIAFYQYIWCKKAGRHGEIASINTVIL